MACVVSEEGYCVGRWDCRFHANSVQLSTTDLRIRSHPYRLWAIEVWTWMITVLGCARVRLGTHRPRGPLATFREVYWTQLYIPADVSRTACDVGVTALDRSYILNADEGDGTSQAPAASRPAFATELSQPRGEGNCCCVSLLVIRWPAHSSRTRNLRPSMTICANCFGVIS